MDQAIQLYSPPTLHISNCVTVKLTEKNYLLWKTQFESFLSGQNLLGFVNGAFPQLLASIPVLAIDGQVSHVTNPDFLAWHRADKVVRAWLLGSLSEDIMRDVVHTTTARDLWSALAQHFNKISASRLFELQHKLQTVEKLDKSMDEYLKEIKRVCEQLASIGSPVSEQMKIFAALKGSPVTLTAL
ncbi:PREDICTED: uncharacterized protein LOC109130752 [Camelina sativa]|uniref:Uncharacterized protein LOC109130752 n=1 Tax=Camelina sativa TaxID=90675 RepID=A0ABM1RBA4_CAMSA|nr:PREDICTED: uncharacterized protein LOC109130752 [Camelina sativa]